MKKYLVDNLVIKIVSVILSVMLWFVIITIVAPEQEVTIRDVPVIYLNKGGLKSNNLIITSDKESDTGPSQFVDVTFKGPRNVVGGINKDDFRVTIDLIECELPGEYSILIDAQFRPNANSADLTISGLSPEKIEVTVDDIETRVLEVEVEFNGTELPEHYLFGRQNLSPETVTIEGPKSEIDLIESAEVRINATGQTEDIKIKSEVTLVVAGGSVNTNHLIKMNVETVDVYYEVLKRKKVPVVPQLTKTSGIEILLENDTEDDESGTSPTHRTVEYEAIIIGTREVVIIGPEALVDSIDEIGTRLINPQTYGEGEVRNEDLIIPENIETEHNETAVTVKINKKEVETQ